MDRADRRVHYRPVVVEVPHFASLRDGEREISILRSEDGQTWKPHVQAASDWHKDVQDVIKACTGGMKSRNQLCVMQIVGFVSARIIFTVSLLLQSHVIKVVISIVMLCCLCIGPNV